MMAFAASIHESTEKYLDSQLWHACAGGMVQMPAVNSMVYYFPQGHAEHASGNVDFLNCPRIQAFALCKVAGVKFMADTETDEVYAKIRLIPVRNSDSNYGDEDGVPGNGGADISDKPASFAKTLTQSDANNGGGFSVPRYCAETIFPRLDYSADPPVQTVIAKDVHGEIWKFRHIYRGTPRRHLLTTGWSTFVNHKKLVAGDSIVFLRAENGDLCVGIRRAKRGAGIGLDSPSGWSSTGNSLSPYGGFSMFVREDESKLIRNSSNGSLQSSGLLKGRAKVRPESVIEAVTLAANEQPFEVVYYPRACTPEYCVKASAVRAAMRIKWCSGMRFKMAFETEDSSRISWFMGTISLVQVADPIRWSNSPWRLLQVTWDEPDLLQNVRRVNPWLVEVVSNMPAIHLTPFSPPRKKLRLSQHPDFPLDGQLPAPNISSNHHFLGPSSPMCYLTNSTPAGIQGARHPQFGLSLSDIRINKLQVGLYPAEFRPVMHGHNHQPQVSFLGNLNAVPDGVSCLLTVGNSPVSAKKTESGSTPQFILFGQPILTEQQISLSNSANSSDGNPAKTSNLSFDGPLDKCSGESPLSSEWRSGETMSETGHCKVFMESEDVGRTLDLSVLGSYEELYRRLANMFGIERTEMASHVLYRDAKGALKHTGDEPFNEFTRTARRLTILMGSANDS